MKIIINQIRDKISVEFHYGKVVDNYIIDKADEFLIGIDRFLKKRKIRVESLQKADLKFVNTGLLTERVIRAIMLGLCF